MKVFVLLFAFVVAVFGQADIEVQNECATACPMLYAPVCCTYSDGTRETHGNTCAAASYECVEKKTRTAIVDGECDAEAQEPVEEPAQPACPEIFCTADYNPVCCTYSDGTTMTHGNSCQAGSYNCREQKTPTSTTKGECGMFYILPFPYPAKPMPRPQIFIPIIPSPPQPQA